MSTAPTSGQLHDTDFPVRVVGRVEAARGVVLLELGPVGATPLPRWRAGSHVDVVLPDGDTRQYSLVGDVTAATWRIGVLREDGGRGGSRWLHDGVAVGDELRVAGPRNHFEFEPLKGTRCLFVAGGIGITPISAMIAAAERVGVEWELHYVGRSRATMALLDELEARYPARVRAYPSDEGRRLDLPSLLPTCPRSRSPTAAGLLASWRPSRRRRPGAS